MKQNLFYADVLKAFAILLVTVGHAFNGLGFSASYFRKFIYSFHMPLFFAISGFLAAYAVVSLVESRSAPPIGLRWSMQFIVKKFRALIIPYLTWLFVVRPWFFQGQVVSLDAYIGFWNQYVVHNTGFWFLPCLFLLMIGFSINAMIVSKVRKCHVAVDLASAALIVLAYGVAYRVTGNDFLRSPLSYGLPFFTGVYLGRFSKFREYVFSSDMLFTISIVVFCIASGFFIELPDAEGKMFRLIAGQSAILASFRLAKAFDAGAEKPYARWVSCLSKNTLIIYVMQNPFIYTRYGKTEMLASVIPPMGQLGLAIALAVAVIGVCFCAAFVISKSRLLGFFLLGKALRR